MKTVKVPCVAEYDIEIVLPGNRKFLVQYRNYQGNLKTGEDSSVDIILDEPSAVYNWKGSAMTPAPAIRKPHVRKADQLCIMLPVAYLTGL